MDAIRAVWMEGYNYARRELGVPPFVEISPGDLEATYEHGTCADPEHCPACSAAREAPRG